MGAKIGATAVVLLVLAGAVGGPAVAAQEEDPELYFTGNGEENYYTNVGDTLTLDVVLSDVDDGVDDFEYEFAISEPARGDFVDAEGGPGVSDLRVERGPDNDTMVLAGSGGSFDDSHAQTHLTITVRGDAPGRFDVVPERTSVTNASGAAYDLETRDQYVEVTHQPIAVASARQGPGSAYDHTMPVAGEGEVTVVAHAVDNGVGSFTLEIEQQGRSDAADMRFVDVSVRGDPAERSVSYSPNGSYVEVNASGLDTADTGTVPLVNLTVRGLEEGEAHLNYPTYTIYDEDGNEYAIDHHRIAGVEFTEASSAGTPTFTEAAPSDGAAERTAANATTTGGTDGATPTSGSGPGFTALATLLAVALAAAGRQYCSGE